MRDYLYGLATLLLVMTSGAAIAQEFDGSPAMRGGYGHPQRMLEHLSRRLDLDETQQQAVKNIVEAATPEMDALRDRARKNRDAVRDLVVSDPDYDAKLSNLARENGELATIATLLHGRLRAEIDALLSPEQRETLATEGKREDKRWRKYRE
jgi:protein CpxP